MSRSPRKPRAPRARPRAPQQSKAALQAQILWKTRVVQLETRMTVLELFLGLHESQPPLQTVVDAIRSVSSEEE